MIDISDLLNVPYKEYGRSKEEGFDCYGLAIEVYRRMGYSLPDVVYGAEHLPKLVQENIGLFPMMIETDKAEYGVLLEMVYKGNLHIGVCLDDKNFIHTTEKGVRINHIGVVEIKGMYKWQ